LPNKAAIIMKPMMDDFKAIIKDSSQVSSDSLLSDIRIGSNQLWFVLLVNSEVAVAAVVLYPTIFLSVEPVFLSLLPEPLWDLLFG
jgi:hypothetical protein